MSSSGARRWNDVEYITETTAAAVREMKPTSLIERVCGDELAAVQGGVGRELADVDLN